MRIGICEFKTETTTFNPEEITLADFDNVLHVAGPEVLRRVTPSSELAGVLRSAESQNVTIVPITAARAMAGGFLEREAMRALLGEFEEHLRAAGRLDGLLYVLHGAVVSQVVDDVTGEFLRVARLVVGPDTPIVATLDYHANVTMQIVEMVDAAVGYRTFPHNDFVETGMRGFELLARLVRGQLTPVSAFRKLPMIVPPENAQTTEGPMAEVMEALAALERENPGKLWCSVFVTHPWLDVPDVGCSVLAIADGDLCLAGHAADKLALMLWERRHELTPHLLGVEEAVLSAVRSPLTPVVIADSSDSVSSGAPGDSTVLLAEILQHADELSGAVLVPMVDPAAVQAVLGGAPAVGSKVIVELGGRSTPRSGAPLTIVAEVEAVSDGAFRVESGPEAGVTWARGRTLVLGIGRVRVVVSERRVSTWSPEFYSSLGLDPRVASIVVVKSPNSFRTAYQGIAKRTLVVNTHGVCDPDLRSLPWKRVARPVYPLDDCGRAWARGLSQLPIGTECHACERGPR